MGSHSLKCGCSGDHTSPVPARFRVSPPASETLHSKDESPNFSPRQNSSRDFVILCQNRSDLEVLERCRTSVPNVTIPLHVDVDEVDEGETVTCDECGTELEIVSLEPLELVPVDAEGYDDEDLSREDDDDEDA